MRGRRPWVVNSRIDGSGRACQRPRTSRGAKCFSCEGALAREIAFFKFFEVLKLMLRWAERVFTPSGARAQRGRIERGDKNREGVASGSATQKTLFSFVINK